MIRFSYGGLKHDLFLDPKDGSLVWTRDTGDAETYWTRLEDWRDVKGMLFPHRQRTFRPIEAENADISWTTVRVNSGVLPGRFARPAPGGGVTTIAGGARSTGWIPMTHHGRYIFLRGRINSHETDVVLDSGAGMTTVDASVAARLGIEGTDTIETTGVGGPAQGSVTPAALRVEVGTLSLDRARGLILDMSEVGRMVGRELPVVLGMDVFQELVVDIDYPRARVAFHAPRDFRYEGAGSTVALFPGPQGRNVIEASVEGLPLALFVLNTGSSGTVDAFRAFSEQHQLLHGRRVSEGEDGGIGGRIRTKLATLRSFRCAGFELRQVPAGFPFERKGSFDTEERADNLGAGILARFRLVFDYSRELLHVEPGPDWESRPFAKNRVGLYVDFRDGALKVTFVAPGSPAAQAGWRAGDRVTAVDGRKISSATWSDEMGRWPTCQQAPNWW